MSCSSCGPRYGPAGLSSKKKTELPSCYYCGMQYEPIEPIVTVGRQVFEERHHETCMMVHIHTIGKNISEREGRAAVPLEREERLLRPSWGQIFMQFAVSLSMRSSCRRLQVGCVIAAEDNNRVLSIGYNGNYHGGPNDCDSTEPGACGCIHSEVNAITKLDYNDPSKKIMYVTDSPCVACSKLIINAGINRVVYAREYRITDGLEILRKSGVTTQTISIGEM